MLVVSRFIVILHVVMLVVIKLYFIILNVVLWIVIILNVIMFNVIDLALIWLSVSAPIMLSIECQILMNLQPFNVPKK